MPFEIDTGSWAMFYGKPNGLRSINRWRVFPFPWNPGGFGGSPPIHILIECGRTRLIGRSSSQ